MRTYRDIDELPSYGIPEAALYLHLPYERTKRWTQLLTGEGSSHLISFANLLELHVLKSMRLRSVPFQRIRKAISTLNARFPSPHPLLDRDFLTNGLDLFLEDSIGIINLSRGGQGEIKECVELYLQRIDWAATGLRFFPFITRDVASEPRTIEIDPRLSFGKPVISNTGISTAVVAGRFRRRDTMVELAEEYGVSLQVIEDAIRWEMPTLNAA